MKRPELFFSFLLVPLDYLMIILAALTAYYIRFSEIFRGLRPATFNLPLNEYLKVVFFIGIFWLLIFALSGLYTIKSARKLLKEIYRVILACSTGLMLIVIFVFLSRDLFDSRFIVLAGWILAILYVSFGRAMVRFTQRLFFSYGIGVKKTVIVGAGKTADFLVGLFAKERTCGFETVKRLRDFELETAQELSEFIKNNEVDEIIQSDPGLSKTETLRLYDFADEHHLGFKYVADLLGTKVLKTEFSEFAGIPIMEVKKTTLDGWGRIFKRFSDLIGALILLIFFSPLIILSAIAIKLESNGPIFFSRRDDGSPLFRIGAGGQPFRYFKLRTMRDRTDSMRYKDLAAQNVRADGPLVKISDDPRITRVGKILRRFSIDELSEFFLVLKGDMSLVGPRPHLPEEVAKYERHHKKVLDIKPGITGLAQISGRSDLSFEEEVKLDTYYIENWSPLLDLTILLRTPLAVIRKRDAE
ncbi:MAG: sugar transferase [Patescibacteria group bacterium]|jgi:exopolysaccharide biosynthesis polyprenyl glycosylphosphotransferase